MSQPQIKIRVGASVDASLDQVFKSLRTASAQARKAISEDAASASKSLAVGYRDNARIAEKEISGIGAEAKRTTSVIGTATSDAAVKFRMLSDSAKQLTPTLQAVAREAQRELDKIERAGARTALGLGSKSGPGFMSRGLSMASGPAMTALSFGARVAGDLARGAGVDLDFTSQLSKNTSLQSTLTTLSNSGYMPGAKGPNGQRQDTAALGTELSKTASETGFAVNDAAEGLAAFVGKTGDLQTGRDVFKDLAILSKATGTNLQDMVDAAGDVSNNLGDIPNKGQRISEVMRAIAGQGKLGAVEIRDLSSQMAKLAAMAPKFEGDAGKNMGFMGALAQEARQRGGAASATQAATSVMAFTNTFSKGARFDAFKAMGVDVYSKTEKGKFRDPKDIILDALKASGGDPLKMNSMFKDAGVQRAVSGFSSIYNDAYSKSDGDDKAKQAAAIAAVSAEMDRLTQSSMGAGEVLDSFNAAMKTSESKANTFNNQLQETASKVQAGLLPAFEALTPAILWATKQIGDLGLGMATTLKKLGIGGDEATDDFSANMKARNLITDLQTKQKNGTATQADVDLAKAELDHLEQRRKGKVAEFKAGADTKPGYFEQAAATAFDQSPIGRIANKIAGTKLGAGLIDEKQGELSRRNGELDQIDSLKSKLTSTTGAIEVTVKNMPKTPLTQPRAGTVPVEAKP